jgi:oligopeptide/dipeptide ABC transporter ATP-binding protein
MNLINVSNLKKHFIIDDGIIQRLRGNTRKIKAVNGIDFTLEEGKSLTIVGESGCGKSTAIETALRQQEPTEGDIKFKNKDIESYSEKALRSEVQLIHQNQQDTLNPRMSVSETIAEAIRFHDITTEENIQTRVDELLQRVGVSPSEKRQYPNSFSGGQKQRIAIARALAVEPSLLVADEPVSGLDVSVQAQILNRLMDLQDEFDLGLIYVTHNLGVARKISDKIAVMYLGSIVEYGDADHIFEDPQHPYTQALLSANPVPDPTTERERIVLRGNVPDPTDIREEGCPFVSRCPEATNKCKTADMGLAPVENASNHLVDCIHR